MQQLIRIDSQNPGSTEVKIADFIKDYLGKLGVKTKVYEFEKNRTNVIGYLKGKSSKTLLITPHIDTVPAGNNWTQPPFSGKIVGNKVYGLGSTDCKCNVAVSLEVIKSLIEQGVILDYNLIFAATADEETGSDLGIIPLLKKGILKPDAALILDADDFVLVVAQKGLFHLKVKLRGKKAHGAYPWLGENAIDKAVDILHDLKKYKFKYKNSKYLRPPTLNVGLIRGGDKVNIVADWCEFELDFRFLPGMTAEGFLKDLKKIIRRHTNKFKIEIDGIQKHYKISQEHPLVKALVNSLKKYKIRPKITGSEGATVITFFQDKKIPAIASGFGVEGTAHGINEYVTIDNLYKGSLVLEDFLKTYKF